MNGLAEIKRRFREFAEGDEEGVDGLISRFFKTNADHWKALEVAVKSKDAREIERVAHGAIGACDMFGLSTLSSLLRGLERSVGRGDLASAGTVLDEIRAEDERIRSGLA